MDDKTKKELEELEEFNNLVGTEHDRLAAQARDIITMAKEISQRFSKATAKKYERIQKHRTTINPNMQQQRGK